MDVRTEILISEVLNTGAVSIRNVPQRITNEEVPNLPKEQQPFLYASGNWGPGYAMIKGLVGRKEVFRSLLFQLSFKIGSESPGINFVAGNVTGGQIPGWVLSEYLGEYFNQVVPYVYVRDMRKKGGHKELVTGIENNPEIKPGDNCLIVEELVNFAQTTCNSAQVMRELGYTVTHAACILFYNNPVAIRELEANGVEMIYLFTLSELLDVAEKTQVFNKNLIADYRTFLADPPAWQTKRGLTRVEQGGTK